jgi:hypothetical protein
VRLWFAQEGDLLWLRADETPSGSGPDWYRNLVAEPLCQVVVGSKKVEARLEPSDDVNIELRRLVELWRAKYGPEWVQDWYVEKGRVPVKLRLGRDVAPRPA